MAVSCLLISRLRSVTEESDVNVDEDGFEAITVVVSLRGCKLLSVLRIRSENWTSQSTSAGSSHHDVGTRSGLRVGILSKMTAVTMWSTSMRTSGLTMQGACSAGWTGGSANATLKKEPVVVLRRSCWLA